MGILNRTPDSFFDKGATWDWDAFWRRADQIVSEGADILDVGAVKAGPGPEVDEDEELGRLMPAVEGLVARFDLPVSVDTWRASVAAEAYRAGAVLGNDISGFADPKYLDVAAAAGASVVATHIRLAPRVPDPEPVYNDLVSDVCAFLTERASRALAAGIPASRVLVDAGLDLGKTASQSLELLRASSTLAALGYPLLLSASNKTFLGRRPRPGDRPAPGGLHLGPRPWDRPRVPGGAGARRAWDLPGRDMLAAMMEARVEAARPAAQEAAGEPGAPADKTGSWLVTGDDASLLADAVSKLVGELVGKRERSFVVEDFAGEELDVAAVVDACRTPPLFSDRRVVVLREAGALTSDQLQPLLSYLEEPMPSTKLVVAGGGGTLPAKFVNAFKQTGAAVLNTDVGSREAHGWVTERLSHGPVKLEPAAAAQVEAHLERTSTGSACSWSPWRPPTGPGRGSAPKSSRPTSASPARCRPGTSQTRSTEGETRRGAQAVAPPHGGGSRHPLVVLAILHRHFGNILRVQSPDNRDRGPGGRGARHRQGPQHLPRPQGARRRPPPGGCVAAGMPSSPSGRRAGPQGQVGLGTLRPCWEACS